MKSHEDALTKLETKQKAILAHDEAEEQKNEKELKSKVAALNHV